MSVPGGASALGREGEIGVYPEVRVELVPTPVDDRRHHRVRRQLARHPRLDPGGLGLGLLGPHEQVPTLGRRGHGVGQGLEVERLVLEGVQGGLGQRPELVLAAGLGLGLLVRGLVDEPLVLVVGEELHHVVGADGGAVAQGHGPGDLEDLVQRLDVHGDDAVDVLARLGLPHLRRQRPVDVELGGEPEVAPVLAGLEPSPARLEVTGGADPARGHRDAHGLVDVRQLQVPVVGAERAHLEEVTRARPHLGVVRHEQEVRLGSLEDAGQRPRPRPRRAAGACAPGSRSRTKVSCFDASGATSASDGPVSIRPRARSVSAAKAASLRSSMTRSGPLLWGAWSTPWAWSMALAPISATWPEAEDRSCTERSCRPITGTMSRGARSGECNRPSAESNSCCRREQRRGGGTVHDVGRGEMRLGLRPRPPCRDWRARGPSARTTAAATNHSTTTATTAHTMRRRRRRSSSRPAPVAGAAGTSPVAAGHVVGVGHPGSGPMPRGTHSNVAARSTSTASSRAVLRYPSSGPPMGSATSSSAELPTRSVRCRP